MSKVSKFYVGQSAEETITVTEKLSMRPQISAAITTQSILPRTMRKRRVSKEGLPTVWSGRRLHQS